MFWMRNKENKFTIRTLIWGPGKMFRSGSKLIAKVIREETQKSLLAQKEFKLVKMLLVSDKKQR